MTKRRCRDKISEHGLTEAEVIQMAMDKLQWPKAKVISWYNKENPALKKARPRELVDRGDTDRIVELLDKRERDRIAEQFNKNKS
jgi:hypothetical protein